MGKLFVLLNILPILLGTFGLFTYYVVIDGTCLKYPYVYPNICRLLGHIGHSIKTPEMTALKAGDRFPEGVEFRYALHAALNAAVRPTETLRSLVAVGYHTQKRKTLSHPAAFFKHTTPAKNLQTRR